MTAITLYEVGGCVRDRILGTASKDVDYAVEAASFDHMRDFLTRHGVEIFLETPQYLTIRARFPKQLPAALAAQIPPSDDLARLTADFVLCRSDGDYSDGRRPDTVTAGTILEDLSRRDFTANAIARRADGSLLDPYDGEQDALARRLRAVGSAHDRLAEDSLRALRAVRFAITKGFTLDPELRDALSAPWLPDALAAVSAERRREELHKAFRADTAGTLTLLASLGPDFLPAALGTELWLKPTAER